MRRTVGNLALVLVLGLVAWGCRSASVDDATQWAIEADRFFAGLAEALSADDVYGALDFYAPGASVRSRTSDFQDAAIPVHHYLASHRADLAVEMIDVHVSEDGALLLVRWPQSGRFGAVVVDVAGGAITEETVLVDLDSLERSLLASPDVAVRYRSLYDEYLRAWSGSGEPSAVYAPGATVHTPFGGSDQLPLGEPAASVALRDLSPDQRDGAVPAVFLDPTSFGDDPGRVAFVVDRSLGECTVHTAVVIELDGDSIIGEHRYVGADGVRRCGSASPPRGWWTGLELPQPRDLGVTGRINDGAGRSILVHNGAPRLEALVTWGLDRFPAAGLAEPVLGSVTFEPTRRCEGVGGRLTAGEISNDLVLCIYEDDLCRAACDRPLLAVRTAMLHELGHAWLNDHASPSVREDFMEVAGLSAWFDPGLAWSERGVEYAAEVLAWGLIDEPIALAQLGDPPCETLSEAFRTLTGTPPVTVCRA